MRTLILIVALQAAQAGAEQHMRAVLHQSYEAKLRESALATAGARRPEAGAVPGCVGPLPAGAVQADQPPRPIPRPLGGVRRNRPDPLLIQPMQRRLAQAGAGLRDAAPAPPPDPPRPPQPAQ